jgi:hypothetical protein
MGATVKITGQLLELRPVYRHADLEVRRRLVL